MQSKKKVKGGEKDGDKDIQFFEFIQLILFVLFKKRPRKRFGVYRN